MIPTGRYFKCACCGTECAEGCVVTTLCSLCNAAGCKKRQPCKKIDRLLQRKAKQSSSQVEGDILEGLQEFTDTLKDESWRDRPPLL